MEAVAGVLRALAASVWEPLVRALEVVVDSILTQQAHDMHTFIIPILLTRTQKYHSREVKGLAEDDMLRS